MSRIRVICSREWSATGYLSMKRLKLSFAEKHKRLISGVRLCITPQIAKNAYGTYSFWRWRNLYPAQPAYGRWDWHYLACSVCERYFWRHRHLSRHSRLRSSRTPCPPPSFESDPLRFTTILYNYPPPGWAINFFLVAPVFLVCYVQDRLYTTLPASHRHVAVQSRLHLLAVAFQHALCCCWTTCLIWGLGLPIPLVLNTLAGFCPSQSVRQNLKLLLFRHETGGHFPPIAMKNMTEDQCASGMSIMDPTANVSRPTRIAHL